MIRISIKIIALIFLKATTFFSLKTTGVWFRGRFIAFGTHGLAKKFPQALGAKDGLETTALNAEGRDEAQGSGTATT